MDAENGPLRKVNDIHRNQLFQEMIAQAQGRPITAEMNAVAKINHLELMRSEYADRNILACSRRRQRRFSS